MTRRLGLALALLTCLGAAPSREPPARLSPAQRARFYHRWALEALDDASPEGRQRASRDILKAIELEPDHAEHWLLLGKVRVLGEYDAASRECFRRAILLAPRDPTGYLELAAAWKREWTRTLDTLSLRRAVGLLDTAAALRPGASEAWLRLVTLRYEGGDFAGAERAATRALAGRPRRTEAALAAAYVAFHQGEIERSDSLFAVAIPRLDPSLLPLFDQPSTLLGESAPADWRGVDPDPTTPQNEIQLEYWSRVAHGFLLYYDPDRPGTDARFQTYVQYGAPWVTAVNPSGTQLYFRTFATYTAPRVGRESEKGGNPGRPPVDFPTPIQVWHYPDLGMQVVMQDRSLHGRFQPQATFDFDPASRPDPGLLAGSDDLISFGDGTAVFHRLPPREQRLETRGIVARFSGPVRPRLIAQIEVPGGPGDSLRARWVVTDAIGQALARGEQTLALDACDPAERRTGQFSADFPPGAYLVTVSVRGAAGKRGLFQTRMALEPDPQGLALSDLVLVCGDPALLIGGASARFDANVEARVTGSKPMAGYLEIYQLGAGSDGLAHFAYVCNVRRAQGSERKSKRREREERAVLVSTSREESQPGTMRRQFVVVPVQSLAPGRYELEVRVKDLVSGAEAVRSAEFVRE